MKKKEKSPELRLIVATTAQDDPDARLQQASRRMAGRFARLSEKDLLVVNLDVPRAVAMVLRAVPGILQLRAELARLASFDATKADTLADAALALAHAHIKRAPVRNGSELIALADSVRKVRRQLRADAAVLVDRGLLKGRKLARLRGGPSYLTIAFDVLALVQAFRDQWQHVAGRTGVSKEELDEADVAANHLVLALGMSKADDRAVSAATIVHRQAFTILVRDYSDVRHAVHFLRRNQGDGERIAPTLFARTKLREAKAQRARKGGKGVVDLEAKNRAGAKGPKPEAN